MTRSGDMADVRAELRVHGRVQGVFYRGTAKHEARALGLRGYAANLDDGSVEIVVEGEEKVVDRFVDWCHAGPPHAVVTRIDVAKTKATGEFTAFTTR
jgi:acylphosphatase